jgi:hypothetical protein
MERINPNKQKVRFIAKFVHQATDQRNVVFAFASAVSIVNLGRD